MAPHPRADESSLSYGRDDGSRASEAKSDGVPLWDGKAMLRARTALPDESTVFAEAKNNGQPSDGLMLVYLIELDGGSTDEEPVDPGAFPTART
jgi:hypothetical protein